jgi:DNA-binding CsgD family transcriptional regulator
MSMGAATSTLDPTARRGLREAVTAFRTPASARALVDEAPGIIAGLGFDRVLLSRVDDGVWRPEAMFVRSDPRWADAIMDAGRSEPTRLDTVVETDVVTQGGVFAVDEVQTHPRVHPSIARVSRSDSYGVAPLTVSGEVVGMVHADFYFQRRKVHPDECDLLAVAAECLAAHLSRLLLIEHLHAVLDGAGHGWGRPPAPDPTLPAGTLTDRERDVMRLMAAGETNHGIARRLALSPGTVKTHVSHILRKLDAANRAQAVSVWRET